MKLALLYALFAALATVANIGAQDGLLRLYGGPGQIWACMVLGTVVGLVIKYLLDKRYIFRFRALDTAHDGRTFVLYAAMGLATTAIFWGFELVFHLWFDGLRSMRYLGGAMGLALGYWAKYYLDKRYVFSEGAA
jgi:putative flippase GtrA